MENMNEEKARKRWEVGGKSYWDRWRVDREGQMTTMCQQRRDRTRKVTSHTQYNSPLSAITNTSQPPKASPSRFPTLISHPIPSPSINDALSFIDSISKDMIVILPNPSNHSSSRSNVPTPFRRLKRFNIEYNRALSSPSSKMEWECTMNSVNVSGRIKQDDRSLYLARRRMERRTPRVREVQDGQHNLSDRGESEMKHHQEWYLNGRSNITGWVISSSPSSLIREARLISTGGCSQDPIHQVYRSLRYRHTKRRHRLHSNKLSLPCWR